MGRGYVVIYSKTAGTESLVPTYAYFMSIPANESQKEQIQSGFRSDKMHGPRTRWA